MSEFMRFSMLVSALATFLCAFVCFVTVAKQVKYADAGDIIAALLEYSGGLFLLVCGSVVFTAAIGMF